MTSSAFTAGSFAGHSQCSFGHCGRSNARAPQPGQPSQGLLPRIWNSLFGSDQGQSYESGEGSVAAKLDSLLLKFLLAASKEPGSGYSVNPNDPSAFIFNQRQSLAGTARHVPGTNAWIVTVPSGLLYGQPSVTGSASAKQDSTAPLAAQRGLEAETNDLTGAISSFTHSIEEFRSIVTGLKTELGQRTSDHDTRMSEDAPPIIVLTKDKPQSLPPAKDQDKSL